MSYQFNEYVFWQSSMPNICLFVEMTNHTDVPVNPILMETQVFDDEGEEVFGYLDEIPDVLIPPGKTFCFQTNWIGFAGYHPRVVLSYPEGAEFAAPTQGFIETAGSIRMKSGSFDGVSFEYRNPTREAQTRQTVSVALYDSDGRILYIRTTDTGRFPTAPDSNMWLYWSPYLSNPGIDNELLGMHTKVASVRVFSCYPLEAGTTQRCGDYAYEVLEDGTIALIRCDAQEKNLILPDQIDGYRVSVLREEAVADLNQMVSLTVPEGITTIEAKSIVRCRSLEQVSLPASLTMLHENQFAGCPLTEIRLDADNPVYTVLDGALFNQRNSTLITYPLGITNTSYTIPKGTKAIGKYAFADCSHLQRITLPKGLIRIGEGAFYLCENLSGLEIPDTVSEIEPIAFHGTALSSLVFPDAVTSLSPGLFQHCTRLKTVTLPRELKAIGENVFRDTAIERISLPETVTVIGAWAFVQCLNLKELNIPDAVQTIGEGAFTECLSLQTIHLSPEHPRFAINGGMLCDLEEQRVISCLPDQVGSFAAVPSGIQSIDAMVFSGMKQLTNVNLPDSVIRIGDFAFSDCINLKGIHLPDELKELGSAAFQYCSALKAVNLSDHLTEISEGAFFDCSNLKTIKLPRSLTRIGKQAFTKCSSLTSLNLPETVTRIEYGAFAYCSALNSVYLPAGLTLIEDNVFAHSPSVKVTVTAGSYAEQYCLEHQIPVINPGKSSAR